MKKFDPRNPHERPRRHKKPGRSRQRDASSLNTPVTADAYRIAGYQDGLVGGKRPECDLLRPHYDSGLKWPDPDHPKPEDPLWGAGVRGGITWDGTFYRDLARYNASGPLFWCAYLKPGTAPGIKNGYWLNFGSGWSHLANDDPSQLLTGAAPRLYYDTAASQWKLVIEATMFVTYSVVNVWTGIKAGGNDPAGVYTRLSGCDPTTILSVEPVQDSIPNP
jgi:hypothetical protein